MQYDRTQGAYGKEFSAMHDNNAYTIVSTYIHGRLIMYEVWPTAQIDPVQIGVPTLRLWQKLEQSKKAVLNVETCMARPPRAWIAFSPINLNFPFPR